ncbi:MAG: hypothetical protein WC211_03580 [Dehalococcoidia bacterium]
MPVESESRRHEDWYAEAREQAAPGDVNRPFELESGVSLTLELNTDLAEGIRTDSGGRLEIVAEPGVEVTDDPHIWIEYVSSDAETSVTLYVDRSELSTLIEHLEAARAILDAASEEGQEDA